MAGEKHKYAVITGANKGIGFEICKQLASNGIIVVLTARDEKRGLDAVEKLKKSGFDHVVFHQLDVADPASISSLADFIRTQFGKLDIFVQQRWGWWSSPSRAHADTFAAFIEEGVPIKWNEVMTQSFELAEECIKINYYGTKRMCEALIPLLQLSDSPRIVNVSSSMGKLQHTTNESAKGVLRDLENLTEEIVDKLVSEYLDDYKEGLLENKGWPAFMSAYIVSKAAVNANARILAKNYPTLCINCVCPGYVRTDMNYNTGIVTAEEGAESAVRLALLPKGGPSGLFFSRKEESSFE